MFSQFQTLNSLVLACKWRPPFKQGETLIGVPPPAIFERIHGKLIHIYFISQVLCIPLLLFFKILSCLSFLFIYFFFRIKGDIPSFSIWGYFPPAIPCIPSFHHVVGSPPKMHDSVKRVNGRRTANGGPEKIMNK